MEKWNGFRNCTLINTIISINIKLSPSIVGDFFFVISLSKFICFMNILFSSILINNISTTIRLINNSVVLNNSEYNIQEIENFLSELSDLKYTSVVINYKISIIFNDKKSNNDLFIRWNKINENRLIEIVEDILEQLPNEYYEIN
jgi:hypothetical protein